MPYFIFNITKNKNKKGFHTLAIQRYKKKINLHNSGKEAKFTRGKKWKLVYYEKYSKSDAMKTSIG